MTSDRPDKEILDLFRDEVTRHSGFELLVNTYQKPVYWHIRRLVIDHDDTNDLVQNVFLKIWENLDRFREQSRLFTWIYSIATNEAISFLKHKRTRFLLPLGDVESDLAQSLHDDPYFSGDEVQTTLHQAILTLPLKQRIVFTMRYYDELPYEEMSAILKTSAGALKASYHHAAKKIEKYIMNH